MKAVYGINITEDKDNTRFDGEIFVSERIPETQSQSLGKEIDELEEFEKKADIPVALRIVSYLCGIVSFICLAAVIRNLGHNVSIAKMYSNAPAVFITLCICAPIWLVLFLFKIKIANSVAKSEDFKITMDDVESQTNTAYESLGVPTDAKLIDILCYMYILKNDKIVVKSIGMTSHFTIECMIYVADECLCIADADEKYSIPLECIIKIKTVNKRISISGWNKDTPFNKGEYKQYKITSNAFDSIFLKPYYSIEIHYKGEEYELLIPPYELPALRELIGLTPIE